MNSFAQAQRVLKEALQREGSRAHYLRQERYDLNIYVHKVL
jgi:hypothetical protein